MDGEKILLCVIIVFVSCLALEIMLCYYNMFKRAGKPGWAAFVPFYCTYVKAEIAMGNGFFAFLCMVPYVGFILSQVIQYKFLRRYTYGFIAALTFILPLTFIILPIIAFGENVTISSTNKPTKSETSVVRCMSCYKEIPGVVKGQHFICGYCFAEQDAQ